MLARFTRHAVVRNALSLYGIQIAGFVLPIFTIPYLARVLGPDRLGLINWSNAAVGYFVAITEYGFNFSVTREISIHRDDKERIDRIYTTAMAARFLLMLVSLALFIGITAAVPKMRESWPVLAISFMTVLGSAAFPQWLFQGLEKMGMVTFREVGARFLGLMTLFFLVRTKDDYLWAAAIMSGSSLIAGLVGFAYVNRYTGVSFSGTSIREIRQTLIDGWHIFLSASAITLYTRTNTVLLGFLGSNHELGVFTSVVRLIDTAKALVGPLSTAIYPHVSRLSAESRSAAVAFIQKNIFRLTAPFALISLGMAAGAPLLVPLIFGPGFEESIRLLVIMSPIPFLVALGTSYATFFMLGLGYKKEWSRMIVMTAGLNFVVMIPLVLLPYAGVPLPRSIAMAITGVVVEAFVLLRSYLFYREHREAQFITAPDDAP